MLSGRGLCDGLIARPEESIDCGVSERELEISTRKGLWPTGGGGHLRNKKKRKAIMKLLIM